MSESIFAKGKLFELVHTEQPDGRVFELARRAPGVRLIVQNEQDQILLTKEYRQELQSWDYRLPGGKVFDTLEEYEQFRQSGEDILAVVESKAKVEGSEEAGIQVDALDFYKKSTLGANVEWDLFVLTVLKWHKLSEGQSLEEGEQIETDNWFSHREVEEMILSGEMQEERIALILLQWIKKHGGKS